MNMARVTDMLNRPRPRKIVTVVKSEPTASTTKSSSHESEVRNSDSIERLPSFDPRPASPELQHQSAPRKVQPTAIKKAFVPPPPSFSEVRSPNSSKGPSPTQSPTKIQTIPPRPSEGFDKIALSFAHDLDEDPAPSTASPSTASASTASLVELKSSGEKILDAADKAAGFIGGAFLGQLNKLAVSSNDPKDSFKLSASSSDPFADIMTNLKPPKQSPAPVAEETFQELLCSSETDSFSEVSKSPSFFDSLQKSPTKSPITSPDSLSSQPTGFRASILKHGLSALEKIGKTTADVVVSTRNRIAETGSIEQDLMTSRPLDPIIPDFHDNKSTFYEIFQLYGGHSRLTELQLQSVKASIAMKLRIRASGKSPAKMSSFDFNARRLSQSRIAKNLHPDRIIEYLQSDTAENVLFYSTTELFSAMRSFISIEDWLSVEIECLQRMLRALDSIFVEGPQDLVVCNRRRHSLCQIAVFWCETLHGILNFASTVQFDLEGLSCDIATFVSDIIKYLQRNFDSCCSDFERSIADQTAASKLLIDITYASVPILQSFTFSGLN